MAPGLPSSALPKAGKAATGVGWQQLQQAAPRLPTVAAAQPQPQLVQLAGTPSAALPKHMLQAAAAAAPKAATPAPATPAEDAGGAPSRAAQQPVALPPAAMLDDDVLAYDFGGAAARILEGHESLMEESAALSAPVADAVQEQLLALDQVRGYGGHASGG